MAACWRRLKIDFLALPIPRWLTPHANADTFVENGMYRFHVEFSLPAIGSLVSYQGMLQVENNHEHLDIWSRSNNHFYV